MAPSGTRLLADDEALGPSGGSPSRAWNALDGLDRGVHAWMLKDWIEEPPATDDSNSSSGGFPALTSGHWPRRRTVEPALSLPSPTRSGSGEGSTSSSTPSPLFGGRVASASSPTASATAGTAPSTPTSGTAAAAAAAFMKPQSYPCRAGAPDCLHYLKTGRCQFGARCKFNHPPRDARLIHSLNRRDCFDWVVTGSCPYGAHCKYNHPAPEATERPLLRNSVSGPVGAAAARDAPRRRAPVAPVERETAPWATSPSMTPSAAASRGARPDEMLRIGSVVSLGSAPPDSPSVDPASWPPPSTEVSEARPLHPSPMNVPRSGTRTRALGAPQKPFSAAPGTPVHGRGGGGGNDWSRAPPRPPPPPTSEHRGIPIAGALSVPQSPVVSASGKGMRSVSPFPSSPILSSTWTAPGYVSQAHWGSTEVYGLHSRRTGGTEVRPEASSGLSPQALLYQQPHPFDDNGDGRMSGTTSNRAATIPGHAVWASGGGGESAARWQDEPGMWWAPSSTAASPLLPAESWELLPPSLQGVGERVARGEERGVMGLPPPPPPPDPAN